VNSSMEEVQLEREGSLMPVIDVIPDSVYRNPTWKGLGYFFRDLAIYVGMVVLLVFVTNPLIDVPIEVLTILAVTGLFVVAHDSRTARSLTPSARTRLSDASQCCPRGTSLRPGYSATTGFTTPSPCARATTSSGIP